MLKRENKLFIIIVIILFLLVPLKFIIPELNFLFLPIELSGNIYGLISAFFILIPIITWRFLDFSSSKRNKIDFKHYLSYLSYLANFIGLKKPVPVKMVIAIIIGLFTGLLTLIAMGKSINLNLNTFIVFLTLRPLNVASLLIVPVFEECVYRGLFISQFLNIFQKNRILVGLAAITLSSFIFAWTHPHAPFKLIGGFVLGIVYIWNWKKDLNAAIITHMVTNISILLYVDLQTEVNFFG